ncbi:hypothetical protein FGB62_17g04 [Gracilaria domingensis]|nr:hypothetical protein FGB62_17g04 [Gracilaria domingensis]
MEPHRHRRLASHLSHTDPSKHFAHSITCYVYTSDPRVRRVQEGFSNPGRAVYLLTALSTNQTASADQPSPRSEQVKDLELLLEIHAPKAQVLYRVEQAFAAVMHRWRVTHTVFPCHRDQPDEQAAKNPWRNIRFSFRFLHREPSAPTFTQTSRVRISYPGTAVNPGNVFPNTLRFYTSIYNAGGAYVETNILDTVDIDLLLALFILRKGNTCRLKTDYFHVLRALHDEPNSAHTTLTDGFPNPLPPNVRARFWPEIEVKGKKLSDVQKRENSFKVQPVHALGSPCFAFDHTGQGYWWRRENDFVAIYSGNWRTRDDHGLNGWSTAVYAYALKNALSSTSHHRRWTRKVQEEFAHIILNLYPILAFTSRGVYRVGGLIFFVEHGLQSWLSDHIKLRPPSGKYHLFHTTRVAYGLALLISHRLYELQPNSDSDS